MKTAPEAPTAELVIVLVRSSLLTLNDAVLTGNFTVLRDKLAPDFRNAATATQLSVAFSKLSQQKLDLVDAAIAAPTLDATPAIDDKGILRIKGRATTKNVIVVFNFAFKSIDGVWKLVALSVQADPAGTVGIVSDHAADTKSQATPPKTPTNAK